VGRQIATAFTGIGFVSPALALFLFFEVFSLAYNVFMSFHEWRGFGQPKFVGLDNFTFLATDPVFTQALFHNAIFMIVALALMAGASLLLALLLDSGMPGAGVFRGLLFLPVVIPVIVVGLVWTRVFAAQGGLLNNLLALIGLGSLQHDWLGDPKTALIAILIVWVWRQIGYGIILFGAGLLGVPNELKEAALLDGASSAQIVWRIVLPLLKPVIFVVLILYAIWAIKIFPLIYLMTDGGPYHATEVMNTYMYKSVFNSFQLGIGSAVTTVGIIFVALFTLLRSRFQTNVEF
jgi:raffinose/stachyose/melibiose transport system permease protein